MITSAWLAFETVLCIVQDVLMAFSRDHDVQSQCVVLPHTPMTATWSSGGSSTTATPFPPCGVLPHRLLSQYVVPLCYLYSNDFEVYSVFRRMVRSWRLSCLMSLLRSRIVHCVTCCCWLTIDDVCGVVDCPSVL